MYDYYATEKEEIFFMLSKFDLPRRNSHLHQVIDSTQSSATKQCAFNIRVSK